MSFSHGWVLRLLRQSNAAQIAGNDSQAQPALHPVLPVVAAFAPAKVPPQAGNAALDTRTPAIAPFPRTCPFQGFAFLRQLARSWDGHPLDSRGFELVLRRSEEHTSELQSRQYLVCRLLLEKKKNSRGDRRRRFASL